jgi:hypothetical protein
MSKDVAAVPQQIADPSRRLSRRAEGWPAVLITVVVVAFGLLLIAMGAT